MKYEAMYEFVTGETLAIEIVDKHIQEAIEEMELYEKIRNRAETRRHEAYVEGQTEELHEYVCLNGHFLTPEQALFHKLWIAEQAERLRKLRRVLRKLTKPQHRLIRQFYYKNMSETEIAREKRCSVSNVSQNLKRTLKFLRREF